MNVNTFLNTSKQSNKIEILPIFRNPVPLLFLDIWQKSKFFLGLRQKWGPVSYKFSEKILGSLFSKIWWFSKKKINYLTVFRGFWRFSVPPQRKKAPAVEKCGNPFFCAPPKIFRRIFHFRPRSPQKNLAITNVQSEARLLQ